MADMYLGNESGGFDLVGTTNIKNIDFEEAKISKEDYENLSEEERKTGIHLVTGLDDTENGGGSADLISYDNTNSGLGSTNVQGAIDELNSNLPFKFGIDGDGNYGYYGADGSLIPFLGTISFKVVLNGTNSNISTNTPFIYENNKYKYLKIVYGGYMNCTVKGDSTTLYSRADGSYVTGVTKICDISSYSKISVSGSNTGYTNATVGLTFSSSPLS